MALPSRLRFDRHKSHSARSIPKIIKPNCTNRSAVEPQKQRMVSRAVFVGMIFIVVGKSSSFPENSAAD